MTLFYKILIYTYIFKLLLIPFNQFKYSNVELQFVIFDISNKGMLARPISEEKPIKGT